MTLLVPDYLNIVRNWWASIGPDMSTPFTPGALQGGNDGKVRSAKGEIIVDCGGNEAKADVIAASLNYVALVKDKTPFIVSVDESHYKMGINDGVRKERLRIVEILHNLITANTSASVHYNGALSEAINKIENGH
jgi:hypothetical protein